MAIENHMTAVRGISCGLHTERHIFAAGFATALGEELPPGRSRMISLSKMDIAPAKLPSVLGSKILSKSETDKLQLLRRRVSELHRVVNQNCGSSRHHKQQELTSEYARQLASEDGEFLIPDSGQILSEMEQRDSSARAALAILSQDCQAYLRPIYARLWKEVLAKAADHTKRLEARAASEGFTLSVQQRLAAVELAAYLKSLSEAEHPGYGFDPSERLAALGVEI